MGAPVSSRKPTQPLLSIGPTDGLDATTDPFYIEGNYTRDLINFAPNHFYKSLAPIRGRIPGAFFFPGHATSLVLDYPQNEPPALVAVTTIGEFVTQNPLDPEPWTSIPVPLWKGNGPTGKAGEFTRYKAWLFFTNDDPNGLCYKFSSELNATFWGIYAPPALPATTVTSPSNGMIYGNAYYYRYTYAADRDTDPGLHQESSPSAPAGPFNIGTALGPPTSNGATVVQTPAPTLAPDTLAGTIPANTYFVGTTWITAAGETGISKTASVTITGAPPNEINVTPQSPPAGATGWNIYTGTSSIALTQQGPTRSYPGTPHDEELNYTTTGAPAPPYTGFLNPPAAPIVRSTAGGSLPSRTEYYQLTYVNGAGETTASFETPITLSANTLAVVVSPGANANATGYNVYGSLTSAQEVLQNAAPISIGTNWTEPGTGLILGQSASLVLQGSGDPQVAHINVYRIGGQSLGNWYFVGDVANPGAGNTVTFVDNTPDSGVTGKAMVLHRDPPAPFGVAFTHQERTWGFGYPQYTDFNGNVQPARPCDLWYSNYSEPWGFDNVNQVIPVGQEDAGDVAVQGASLSGIGILWKSKTTWALYGSSPSDFFVSKLFDVGCASAGSAIVALGTAFWLSRQGFYMFDGATLTYLSKPVKAILDSFSEQDFATATACFDDRMYWCSFPTQGITLGYDTVSQNWFKASLSTSIFAFDTEAQSRPTAPDWVFGASTSGNTIDQWFGATTDLGQPVVATLTTRLAAGGTPIASVRARYLELLCPQNLGPNDSAIVTVTANPATVAHSFSKRFGPSAVNQRQRASVPAGIQGDALQLQVTLITSDGTPVSGAAVHGWVRRSYNIVA
jgi:hypothetical protein